MQNKLKSAMGGEKMVDEIPVVRLERLPQNFWRWPGWTEVIAVGQVLLLMGLFVYSGPILRWFDPTVGVLDAGILSIWALSTLLVDSFAVSAWLLTRMVHNTLNLKKNIPSCLEAKMTLGSFWALVSLFVVVFWVLL